jgi:hypothetical protein
MKEIAKCSCRHLKMPHYQNKSAVAEGKFPFLDVSGGTLKDHQALSVSGFGQDQLVRTISVWKY